MPPSQALTAVIAYVFAEGAKPTDLAPLANRYVYLELPTSDDQKFTELVTDSNGKLCDVNASGGVGQPHKFYEPHPSYFIYYGTRQLLSIATLTRSQCAEVKLETRQQDGNAQRFFKVKPPPRFLRLTLQDPSGKPLAWDAVVKVSGKWAPTKPAHETVAPIPLGESGSLEVKCPTHLGLTSHNETIGLTVGELDPLAPGREGASAVQKILTNLGYYRGEITGELDDATRGAVRDFQQAHGIAGEIGMVGPRTSTVLMQEQGQIAGSGAAEMIDPAQDRNTPLRFNAKWDSETLRITTLSTYHEPVDHDPAGSAGPIGKKFGSFRYFPTSAFVVPNGPGEVRRNPIRMPARKFIFMDTGRWLGAARDFGVIWGRHVYLCSYDPNAVGASADLRPGLDTELFKGFEGRVTVQKWASAFWAREVDFDWETLHIVLPDLHLMNTATGSIWFGKFYDLQAELDLLSFVRRLLKIHALQGKIHMVQVGDSYDLWVGREPRLYQTNKDLLVKLVEPAQQSIATLVKWIRDIQGVEPEKKIDWVQDVIWKRGKGEERLLEPLLKQPSGKWLNPAEKAMRLLAAGLGERLVYLHGNHDNYLVLPEVCDAAGLQHRKPFYEGKRVLVEHGHRMESLFPGVGNVIPHNYDGDNTGYDATVKTFNGMKASFESGKTDRFGAVAKVVADRFAMIRDQPSYRNEYARVWLGRQSMQERDPPHIFAIGHTHCPAVFYCDISTFGGD